MTVVYHNIYFVIKKTTKQNKTKQDTKTKKAKKTKKEKRIYVENLTGYDDIVCEFALSTFIWSSREFLLVVYMNSM